MALHDFFGTAPGNREAATVRLSKRPVEEPISANHFVLESPEQSVVGVPQLVFASDADTLSDLARAYGLGYDELIAANPDVDPWLPGENTPVLLPTQFVLPDVPKEGIVLNIASKRLFYFPTVPEGQAAIVKTYPIGIGRVGWETPLGMTTVTAKAKDPHWYVPWSVQQEQAEMGNPLPSVIPPGPENPLGHRVLKLEMPGYLIHGTNQPFGVGMRVSHGCVRLYPENIEYLYELVEIGESVAIINEPFLFGQLDGEWYLESHTPLEDDVLNPEQRLEQLLETHQGQAGAAIEQDEVDHARTIASIANGVPSRLGYHDADEVFARARHVRNTVEVDPDAPTLSEVREMIDEAVREADEEAESL
ncbi:MAG: L,D-transpeptidase family protein [Gammaproteobacteria bacterium]|nr:L,D-transpeptidase family protein [Gammaproteobacteria bacterium]MDH3750918.1 L,D-transpeptidase family protein [Gammaproteobacteria bacterium]MDH3805322.1 L,D-transpeptidase family protein [Gammaproteobacteria bacterium]